MPTRYMGIALCSVFSAWPTLVRAEQTPPRTHAPGEQSNTELVAAIPKTEQTPELAGGTPGVEQARALFWSAHERYDAGQYSEAAQLFEQSYALFPQPEVLFNIALARARSGRCRDAEQSFDEYSRAVGESERTLAARENFLEILAQCSPASDQQPPNDTVSPEPPPAEVAPLPPPAPKPKLAAITLPPLAPGVEDTPPSSYWTTQRVVGWSLLGTAAAATGLALYFDSERREARDAYEELADTQPSNAGDQSTRLYEKHHNAQIGVGISTAVALGSAAIGAGLLIYSGDEAASTTAQIALDPSGARIGLSGRF